VLLVAAFLTFENFCSVLSEDIAIPVDPEESTEVNCGLEAIVSPVVKEGQGVVQVEPNGCEIPDLALDLSILSLASASYVLCISYCYFVRGIHSLPCLFGMLYLQC
jgi:hypothetical protein